MRGFLITKTLPRSPHSLVPMESHLAELADGTRRVQCLLNVYDPQVEEVPSWIGDRHPWTGLDHPNLIRVIASGWDPSSRRFYWAIELVPFGFNLARFLSTQLQRKSLLSVKETQYVMGGVAAGLAALHRAGRRAYVLAPSTVYLSRKGQIRISPGGERLPAYLAPEALMGTSRPGRASDVYSLGVMLYEMIELHHPRGTNHQQNIIPLIEELARGPLRPTRRAPPAFAKILQAMLALEPGDRPSAAEVERFLQTYDD
ncbi:MAG: protein kinase [Myxococcota bacterium]